MSTRADAWKKIEDRIGRQPHRLPQRLSEWAITPVIEQIPDAEWTEMHTGTCDLCQAEPARLYPCGWRCESCRP